MLLKRSDQLGSPGKGKPRADSGSVFALLPAAILIGLFGLGAIGLDIAHNVTARTALQDATDAAALAGAAYLVCGDPNSSVNPATNNPSNGVAPADESTTSTSALSGGAETEAYTVASNNTADGKTVGTTTTGCTITATITPPSGNNSGQSVPGHNGQCTVVAAMPIKNMFAGIFGRKTDTVATTSIATAYASVTSVAPNSVFPLAVSLDTLNGHNAADPVNLPLYMANVGTKETFTLAPEICANAAWTSFDKGATNDPGGAYSDGSAATYVTNAYNSALGISYQQNLIDAQYVGQSQGLALWGDMNSSPAVATLNASLIGVTVNLPIMSGDSPYRAASGTLYVPVAGVSGYGGANMDKAGCRPLLGFVGFKISSVTADPVSGNLGTITGTLVKTLVKGTPGVAFPDVNQPVNVNIVGNNVTLDAALANLSPAMVVLGNNQTSSSVLGLNYGVSSTLGSGANIDAEPLGGYNKTVTQHGGPVTLEPAAASGVTDAQTGNTALPSWMVGQPIALIPVTGSSSEEGTFWNAVGGRSGVGYTNFQVTPGQASTVTIIFTDEMNLDGAPADKYGNPASGSTQPAVNLSNNQVDPAYAPGVDFWTGTPGTTLTQSSTILPTVQQIIPITASQVTGLGGLPDNYNYEIIATIPPIPASMFNPTGGPWLRMYAHDMDRTNDVGIQIFNLQPKGGNCPVQ